jgi:hypothetical protein
MEQALEDEGNNWRRKHVAKTPKTLQLDVVADEAECGKQNMNHKLISGFNSQHQLT